MSNDQLATQPLNTFSRSQTLFGNACHNAEQSGTRSVPDGWWQAVFIILASSGTLRVPLCRAKRQAFPTRRLGTRMCNISYIAFPDWMRYTISCF